MEFIAEGQHLEVVKQELGLILAIKPEEIFEEHAIPEVIHGRIKNLCDQSFFLKTKAACAKSLFENALREGNHQKALESYEENQVTNQQIVVNQKDLWEAIYKVCPKIDRNKVWKLDKDEMKVTLDAESTINKYITHKLGLAAKKEGIA